MNSLSIRLETPIQRHTFKKIFTIQFSKLDYHPFVSLLIIHPPSPAPLQAAIGHYKQKLLQLDEEISARCSERDAQKELVDDHVKKATGVCPRVRAKRTPNHLQQVLGEGERERDID